MGTVHQAAVPQIFQKQYWKTYLDVYPVKNTQHQLYFGLSYSAETDKTLLDKIKKVAKQLKVPVIETTGVAPKKLTPSQSKAP